MSSYDSTTTSDEVDDLVIIFSDSPSEKSELMKVCEETSAEGKGSPKTDCTKASEKRISILIIGKKCLNFEIALQEFHNQMYDSSEKKELKLFIMATLDERIVEKNKEWTDLQESLKKEDIKLVIFLIDVYVSGCLKDVEKELDFLNPLFLARKRINFCLVKNVDEAKVSRYEMKNFCVHFKTFFMCFREYDDESVKKQARLSCMKVQRIIRNPLLF